jgi:hypothetical protein
MPGPSSATPQVLAITINIPSMFSLTSLFQNRMTRQPRAFSQAVRRLSWAADDVCCPPSSSMTIDCLAQTKVRHEVTKRNLAAEFQPQQAAIAQPRPESLLDLGLVSTKAPRSLTGHAAA